MTRTTAVLAGVFALLGVALAQPGGSDLARLQGNWRLERGEAAGEAIPPNEVKQIALVVKEKNYVFIEGNAREEVAFALDPSKTPKAIDVTRKGKAAVLGIYKLEGDTYTSCSAPPGQPRPTSFASSKDNRWEVLVFKRVKN